MACEYGERMDDCISRLLLWTQLVSLHSKGVWYRNLSLPVGETITSIPQGSYIIYIGNQSYKIRF